MSLWSHKQSTAIPPGSCDSESWEQSKDLGTIKRFGQKWMTKEYKKFKVITIYTKKEINLCIVLLAFVLLPVLLHFLTY